MEVPLEILRGFAKNSFAPPTSEKCGQNFLNKKMNITECKY